MPGKADCGGHKDSEAGITGVQYKPVQSESKEASVISGKQILPIPVSAHRYSRACLDTQFTMIQKVTLKPGFPFWTTL